MVPATIAIGTSCSPPNLNSNLHQTHRPLPSHPKKNKNLPARDQIVDLLRRCKGVDQFPPIHARIIKFGGDRDNLLLFKVLRFCSDWRSMDYASKIFRKIKNPDIYLYTAFIDGNITAGSYLDAICRLYSRMVGDATRPDSFVISYVLRTCSLQSALEEGRQIHVQTLKLGLAFERPVRMRLMEFYGKCGKFEDAERLFGEMPD